jgi:diguanylate cyclase (GGDEF)-like protein
VTDKPKREDQVGTVTEPDSLTQTTRLSYEDLVRAAAKGCPRLVVVEGSQLGTMFEITTDPLSIGRDPSNTMVVDEVGVSRKHAVVERRQDGVTLRDLGSKNGTFVNKKQVAEHRLADGDMVFLGSTTLKFLADDNLEHSYYEYLHEISVKDPLTQVPNRRYFDEFLARELARTRRYRRKLALLMLDLDHFKDVNDKFGHLCGDSVLRELSNTITSRLRASEFLARYGGEEFALVLPETDRQGARVVAEQLRALVERHEFCCGDDIIPVTVSIGGAEWNRDMIEPADLINAADEKLYEAKNSGRNKAVV